MFWKKKTAKDLLPPPVRADHAEYSMILSSHDDTPPSKNLVQLSMQAIHEAAKIDLSHLPSAFAALWPGEHYKLLAGLVKVLQPKVLIEIGTATGLSALAMKEYLPKDGRLATFDLFPWKEHPKTVLKESDFKDGKLVQYTDDLSAWEKIIVHKDLLSKASMIFIDATHDGNLEKLLLKHIRCIANTFPLYIVFDDIRVWTMLKMWREISFPKLDLTSFGHWSGTGIVEIAGRGN